jgi:YD repeat-containing protein
MQNTVYKVLNETDKLLALFGNSFCSMRCNVFYFNTMKKRLFSLLFSLICIVVWTQPTIDKKLRDNIAANNIRSQTNWEYKYSGDKPAETGTRTSVTKYNPLGYATEIISYNPKGMVINVEKYRYDETGNKLEYSRFEGGNENQIAYQKICSYDTHNNVTEEKGFDGVEKFSNHYTYDAQGNITEIVYNKNGVLKEKRVFVKDGLKTTVSIYNPSGKMISRLLLNFDSKNNLLEETVYGINQDIIERKIFDYDEKRNIRRESKYKLNKMTLRTTYNYNDAGDLSEIFEEGPDGVKFVKKSIAYNARGFVIEIKSRRKANEDFNSITYGYDAKGICTQSETVYPATQYRALTKYEYEFN